MGRFGPMQAQETGWVFGQFLELAYGDGRRVTGQQRIAGNLFFDFLVYRFFDIDIFDCAFVDQLAGI
ncbi:hypothetical protein D3C85_1855440 [compost metagenome]